MFSLLSATVGLSRVNISRPSLLSWPAWRFFSQSHVQHAGSEDPIAQTKRLDEQMKRHLLPVLREKRNAMRMARYYKNPQDERERERLRRKTQREQNPAGYQVLQKRHYLARLRKQANDPRYGFVKRLHGWCMKYDWVREELPWETHVPVVYSEKVSKQCSGCTHYTVAKGLKLWWKSRNDNNKVVQEQYLCHSCYVGEDSWQRALPKGYEDVRYLKDLIARKKELDGVDHSRRTAKDAKSK